jgi:hypothetical protein
MTGCARSCRHRSFVRQYQAARSAGEQAREDAVGVYGEDSEEWAAFEPAPITFKKWLIDMEGWGE